MQQTTKRRGALLQQLREIDFALVETILYLDAYPDHPQAMEYYHRLLEDRRRLMEEYERAYGPLTATGNYSKSSWEWVKTPWPWEADAD